MAFFRYKSSGVFRLLKMLTYEGEGVASGALGCTVPAVFFSLPDKATEKNVIIFFYTRDAFYTILLAASSSMLLTYSDSTGVSSETEISSITSASGILTSCPDTFSGKSVY